MPAPKDKGTIPLRRGIKFVKKANSWLYFENFNTTNIADHQEWFDTEEQAKARLEEGR
jgi:hypothetical protein